MTRLTVTVRKQVKSRLENQVKSLSHVRLFVTPWTVGHQTLLSMGFFSQEYWSGLPFPSPGDLPDPGIELGSPTLQADSLPSEPPGKLRRKGLLISLTAVTIGSDFGAQENEILQFPFFPISLP